MCTKNYDQMMYDSQEMVRDGRTDGRNKWHIEVGAPPKNMGQSLFNKHSKFQKFDEIFYCGMTRLRNTNLDVFIQCQYTRTILRNKNMGQSLFKKHSKFQNYDEIFYCGMTRHRSSILKYCGLCRYTKDMKKNHLKFQNFNTKGALRKNIMRQVSFRKCSRCHRFSEIFQCVINWRRNTNSRIFRQKPYSKLF